MCLNYSRGHGLTLAAALLLLVFAFAADEQADPPPLNDLIDVTLPSASTVPHTLIMLQRRSLETLPPTGIVQRSRVVAQCVGVSG